MLRKSIILQHPLFLTAKDKKQCVWISSYIIVQCLAVFAGALTIEYCMWRPEKGYYDYDKLARIMYLYDPKACGYNMHKSRSITNLQLSNDTLGLDILPIKWAPAIVTVSTRLSAKTRRYVRLSIMIHFIWMVAAVIFQIFRASQDTRVLKFVLGVFFYGSVFVAVFDLSMAIVYIAHIQQSLTKGMITRYSGWSVELKLKRYYDFGGWIPIAASLCWMRGIVFLALNIYCCRIIRLLIRRIKKREVKKRLMVQENKPIPEADFKEPKDNTVLYYRSGEMLPFVKKRGYLFS